MADVREGGGSNRWERGEGREGSDNQERMERGGSQGNAPGHRGCLHTGSSLCSRSWMSPAQVSLLPQLNSSWLHYFLTTLFFSIFTPDPYLRADSTMAPADGLQFSSSPPAPTSWWNIWERAKPHPMARTRPGTLSYVLVFFWKTRTLSKPQNTNRPFSWPTQVTASPS